MAPPDGSGWRGDVARCIAGVARPIHFVGVGNGLRRDDAVGLVAASALRRVLGRGVPKWVVIHDEDKPERTFSKIPDGQGVLLFDAVQSGSAPGSIICTTLSDTRYGFFATHNVPLRLLPGLSERADRVYILGVEPGSLDVGEGLTSKVKDSVDALVREVAVQVRSSA